MTRSYILLAAILLLAACSKKKNSETVTTTYKDRRFFIVNNTGVAVNFNLYKSRNDYDNATNPIVSIKLNDNDNYLCKPLADDSLYYMDWYSDDLSLSNWAMLNGGYPSKDSIDVAPYYFDAVISLKSQHPFHDLIDDTLYLDLPKRTERDFQGSYFQTFGLRKCLMPSGVSQTVWQAVDQRDFNGLSRWDRMTEWQKKVTLTLDKLGTYLLQYYASETVSQSRSYIYTYDFNLIAFSKPADVLLLYDPYDLNIKRSLTLHAPFRTYTTDTICYITGSNYYLLKRIK